MGRKKLPYIIRNGRNMAWLFDSSRTIMASDRQFAPLRSSDVVKVEPQPNNGHDAIQDTVTLKTSNTDSLSPVLTEEHTAGTKDIQKRPRTQIQKHQAGLAGGQESTEEGCGDVIFACSSVNNCRSLPKKLF